LTISLIVVNKLFYIDDYISIPQFAHFDHWEYCLTQIGIKKPYFYAFFILDTFWSFFLLKFIFGYLKKNLILPETILPKLSRIVNNGTIFTLLFALTWGSDVVENGFYIWYSNKDFIPKWVQCVVFVKEGL